ncbi:MAG TPA: glycosyltransferase family 4 protein [Acidimicrobiia bacterium]|nr:glycosyltransferase family 4 protein [Acidimicrobiia bacterium]
MRVLLVTNDYPPKPGGIQQYLAGLVGSLPAEVRVLAPRDDDATPGVNRDRRRFMWPTRRVRWWVRTEVEDFDPDIVLFGAPYPLAQMGPDLRRQTGVPYGVLCHGAEITLPAAFPVTRSIVRYPLRRADVVFAVSRFTTHRVERLVGRPVRTVGAGVDPAFAPGLRPGGVSVVGCVSRFVPRKGQRRVIEALASLRIDGLAIEGLFVGAGRDETALRRLADRLGVPCRFEVRVPYHRLPGLYREMSVFAMPCRSRWFGLEVEGLGVVYLEAAATGLAVIAGDSGGAPETVLPGVTGFVVDRTDALVEALRILIEDPALATTMGRQGRRRIVDEWSWESVSDRFMEGFTAAVAGVERGGGDASSS